MAKKLAMVAIDKVEVKLTMKVKNFVAVDRVAKSSGLSRASVINGYVEDGLESAGIKPTAADLKRINEIMEENIKKRNVNKAKKGIK